MLQVTPFHNEQTHSDLITVDLHCHSTYSDGALSVHEVLNLAKLNGGQYLALTDHDTVDGIVEAKQYAQAISLHLIPGVEISVTWSNNILIHIIGLNIDETNPELLNGLNQLRGQRESRGRAIAEKLEKIGIKDAYAGAMQYCNNPMALSRTHFGRFLVDNGYAKAGKAFDKYLAQGKPGYVKQQWATLGDAVSWITHSGGIAVIAHPARYKLTRTKLLNLITEFKECGGRGIEVVSSSHSKEDAISIGKIAKDTGLLASMGSDFHNTTPGYAKLSVGINHQLPIICGEAIYNHL